MENDFYSCGGQAWFMFFWHIFYSALSSMPMCIKGARLWSKLLCPIYFTNGLAKSFIWLLALAKSFLEEPRASVENIKKKLS